MRIGAKARYAWACGPFDALLSLKTGEEALGRVGEKAIGGNVLLLAKY